jgi:predicted site-specific integrase-resolvase
MSGSGRRTNDQARIAAIYARVSSERQRQEQTNREPDRRAA